MSQVLTDLHFCGYSEGATGTKKLIANGSHAMICCIFHNEKTPSLSVDLHGRYFKCFGCGKSGSYRELQQIMLPDLYGANREQNKGKMHGMQMSNAASNIRSLTTNSAAAHNLMDGMTRLNSFESDRNIMVPWDNDWRGLDKDFLNLLGSRIWTSRELDISVGNELMDLQRAYFPFKHPRFNFTIGYAARNLQDDIYPNQPKYRNSTLIGTKEILYMMNIIPPKCPIVIVEGAVDAAKLCYRSIPTVASLGTNQWDSFKTRMILAKRPSYVIALGDGDEAGQKFNYKLHQEFSPYIGDKFRYFELKDGLDPGGFEEHHIAHFWQVLNDITGGQLNQLSNNGQENFLFKSKESVEQAIKGEI
ncbi:CHC2 zinc finger domain-containing protein [Yersinia ruckeri]|uniref:CHC2 zinc finger domain-containing protein n=1 Tax=Yersinia ruckeri TaxID=29486 RepID=UPI0022382CE6|nr:CHC2 zinc finger domain-containing protein [Yersinia ruckeri]MCW6598878.1 CHC2 zinc finger domain-containing protein [Yersinia ruckeri]